MSASEPLAALAPTVPAALPQDNLRQSWGVLAILSSVYFFGAIDRSILGLMIQPIKAELLLADWQLGFLTGFAFSLIFLVFGLIMARLADSGNRVTLLTICIVIWSIMTALSGIAVNFLQLCLFRMGVGVGEAGCLPASHSLIGDYFPASHRTKALAVYALGFPFGSLFGSIIAGILLDHWGWRTAFFVVGLPGLVVALMTWRGVREPVRGRFDADHGSGRTKGEALRYRDVLAIMWRSPVLRQMILALVIVGFFASPTTIFLPAYLVRKFALSYTQVGFIVAGTMMAGSSISTIAGSWFAQWLARRRGERWLLWIPAITVPLGAVPYVIGLAQSEWLPFAIWAFFGALINATYLAPCYTVLYSFIPAGGRAKAAVVMSLFMNLIGLSLGPFLAGLANDGLAAWLFETGTKSGEGFMALCPGGEAAAGASAALKLACHASMVNATQAVLIVTMALTVWPGIHFYLAGRALKRQPSRLEKPR
jgi:MFS family permease